MIVQLNYPLMIIYEIKNARTVEYSAQTELFTQHKYSNNKSFLEIVNNYSKSAL